MSSWLEIPKHLRIILNVDRMKWTYPSYSKSAYWSLSLSLMPPSQRGSVARGPRGLTGNFRGKARSPNPFRGSRPGGPRLQWRPLRSSSWERNRECSHRQLLMIDTIHSVILLQRELGNNLNCRSYKQQSRQFDRSSLRPRTLDTPLATARPLLRTHHPPPLRAATAMKARDLSSRQASGVACSPVCRCAGCTGAA